MIKALHINKTIADSNSLFLSFDIIYLHINNIDGSLDIYLEPGQAKQNNWLTLTNQATPFRPEPSDMVWKNHLHSMMLGRFNESG
jgi:hypothetical protein